MVTSRALGGFAMSDTSTFRLSFHVSHPTMSASEIVEAFGLPVWLSQSVGEPRKTKNGKLLDGKYKRTNVIFHPHDQPLSFDDASIEAIIKNQLDNYDIDYIIHLVRSGGECDFLLGIFSSENVMFELSHEVISMLSIAKISMKYDFYGGEEPMGLDSIDIKKPK